MMKMGAAWRAATLGIVAGGIVAGYGLMPGAALAQDEDATVKADAEVTASTDQVTDESDVAETKPRSLDEITVTAQRRVQDIKEVPISVTAVGGEQMEDMHITGMNDLNRVVPSLKVQQGGVFNAIIIRGLGSGVNWGVDQAVGLFIDDVYFTGAEKLSSGLMDVESVQVLRGPQGTLFGRNTIAGAILFTTGQVADEFQAKFAAGFQDRNSKQLEGMVNVPFWGANMGTRLAYRFEEGDGMVYDRLLGGREKQERRNFRGKFRVSPSEDFEVTFTFMDQSGRSEGTKVQYYHVQDEHLQLMKTFDPEAEGSLKDYRHSTNFADGGTETQQDIQFNARLTALNHDFLLIGNMTDMEGFGGIDVDYGPIPILIGTGDRFIDQQSLELRAVSNFGGWFEYVAGLYYFTGNRLHNTTLTLTPILGTDALIDLIVPGALQDVARGILPAQDPESPERFYTRFDQHTDSYSAYGQATIDLMDELSVILGARYAVDVKDVDFIGRGTSVGGIPTGPLLLNYALGAEDFTLIEKRTDKSFDPKISVIYRLNEDVNFYGTVATGSKNGGFNAQAWTSAKKLQFDAESSITYEAGMKGDFFGGGARLNIGLFRTEFTDLQASIWDGTTFVVDNAADVTTQGVELESQILIPWGFMVSLSGAYLDAAYDSFPDGPCTADDGGDNCDISGNNLPNAPEWQISGSVNYLNPLGNMPFDLFAGIDYYWQSEVSLSADGDAVDTEQDYALYNARVGLMGDDQSWNFMIYVKNIADEIAKTTSFDAILLGGTHVASTHAPRTVLGYFSVNF